MKINDFEIFSIGVNFTFNILISCANKNEKNTNMIGTGG